MDGREKAIGFLCNKLLHSGLLQERIELLAPAGGASREKVNLAYSSLALSAL
ncbi:hypothetical protein KZZ20_05840 [Methylacidiphilum fumariolicum]|uniref:hypothetical protein n=1 Tax=Candidatus Methylacidiphilum fumarolicum TaxID=591154 RepID=UPI000306C13A|nr:hypothetical protein [Candidatus Methylacidiphilum fumarolicum]MBW6415034.1 hypothetical protein [Candidatus Methylacidiphilum fumarolicum]